MEHDASINMDYSVAGKRVQLVRTDDPWTKLKPGAQGTAKMWNNALGKSVLFVAWDGGGSMGLIEGLDEWEWLDGQGASE